MINNILLLGFAAFILYGLFSAGKMIYGNYKDRGDKINTLNNFYSQLPGMGFQRLQPGQEPKEIRQVMDSYYVLRSLRRPILVLKATSAYSATLSSFPAYFLVVYEKVKIFGASVGAGGQSTRSEFMGTLAAVRMPLTFQGRTMIFRRPESEDNDNWDWFADTPLLGARSFPVENGLAPDFAKEFSVRSTDKAVSIPRPVQEFLLQNEFFFNNSEFRMSALVIDEHGWGFVSTLITEEDLLKKLIGFQEGLTQLFKRAS